MKESGFRLSIHNHIPKKIHKQPMLAGMYGEAGTPDTYYDYKRDFWVEYKFHHGDSLPKFLKGDALPTEKQQLWLTRRYIAGQNCCSIVGFRVFNKTVGIVLADPVSWSQEEIPLAIYQPNLLTSKQLAEFIISRVS